MDDIAALGREVVEKGFTALKTNIVIPGDPGSVYFSGFGGGQGTTDGNVSSELLRHIVTLIGTFRDAVGPDVGINLDLNFNFKPEACMRIAKALEPFDLLWLEIDMYAPEASVKLRIRRQRRFAPARTSITCATISLILKRAPPMSL